MSVLPYQEIKALCVNGPMIAPWSERQVAYGRSWGLSGASYDVRIAEDILLWPGRFVLASTLEWFQMPADVIGKIMDKSTNIRLGIAVHNTLIDCGFVGYITLEIKMEAFRFLKIRQGTPIAQIVFDRLSAPSEKPYASKYQNQERGPVPAIYERVKP